LRPVSAHPSVLANRARGRYYNAGDRMKYWGKQGAFWDGIWGMSLGAAFFAIPDIGPVAVGVEPAYAASGRLW